MLLLLLLYKYTIELFSVLENDLSGLANESTLIAVVSTPGERIFVDHSLDHESFHEPVKISDQCRMWGMRNASQTRVMVVSRSHTAFPISLSLIIDMTVLLESENVTYENHVPSVSRSVSQKLVLYIDLGVYLEVTYCYCGILTFLCL